MTKIIALYGPSGSGKTTVAMRLADEIPGAKAVSFAFPLAVMAGAIAVNKMFADDMAVEVLGTLLGDRTPKHTFVRVFGEDKWKPMLKGLSDVVSSVLGERLVFDLAKSHILKLKYNKVPLIIVDDLRMPHEYDWLRSEGALLIRVVGRGENDLYDGLLDDREFDVTISNDGALDAFVEAVGKLAKP